MSRYIDADAYAAELWKLRGNYQMLDDTHTADKIMHGIFRAEQALREMPTVDAVPVVLCGECKHWDKWACDKDGRHECLYNGGVWMKDEFCSDGERKDGEHE